MDSLWIAPWQAIKFMGVIKITSIHSTSFFQWCPYYAFHKYYIFKNRIFPSYFTLLFIHCSYSSWYMISMSWIVLHYLGNNPGPFFCIFFNSQSTFIEIIVGGLERMNSCIASCEVTLPSKICYLQDTITFCGSVVSTICSNSFVLNWRKWFFPTSTAQVLSRLPLQYSLFMLYTYSHPKALHVGSDKGSANISIKGICLQQFWWCESIVL